MSTIADKLNLLLENKNAIKAVLEEKGKEPSDVLSTYAQSISELDNEEQVSYVLANADGTQKIYAQLSSKEPITLTATENDIRLGSTAITNEGFIEGAKVIPSYQTKIGVKVVQPNAKVVYQDSAKYDYTEFQATLAVYGTAISNSVQVDKVTVDDALYVANSTTKLADLSKDHENKQVDFGITNGEAKAVMRYTIVKEEY